MATINCDTWVDGLPVYTESSVGCSCDVWWSGLPIWETSSITYLALAATISAQSSITAELSGITEILELAATIAAQSSFTVGEVLWNLYLASVFSSSIAVSFIPEIQYTDRPDVPTKKGWRPIETPPSPWATTGASKTKSAWGVVRQPGVMAQSPKKPNTGFWRPIEISQAQSYERKKNAEQVSDN